MESERPMADSEKVQEFMRLEALLDAMHRALATKNETEPIREAIDRIWLHELFDFERRDLKERAREGHTLDDHRTARAHARWGRASWSPMVFRCLDCGAQSETVRGGGDPWVPICWSTISCRPTPCTYCDHAMTWDGDGRTWCPNPECPGSAGNPRPTVPWSQWGSYGVARSERPGRVHLRIGGPFFTIDLHLLRQEARDLAQALLHHANQEPSKKSP